MKKYASLLLALVLALSLGVSASASETYIYDNAALLSDDDRAALNEAAAAVSGQYSCGVYVVTVDDMAEYVDPGAVSETGESGVAAFAEYAWDALGLESRCDGNGVLLTLSMAERDYDLTAHGGTANAAFTDYGKYLLEDEFLDNFREGDWYTGFVGYISACGRYLEANADGAPIDVEPETPLTVVKDVGPKITLTVGEKFAFGLAVGLPLGVLIAFLVCAAYKRQLKSVRKAGGAALYTVSGGTEITVREDRFTHTTEVRTPIKRESDDHRPHGGGPKFSGGTTVNSGGFSHRGGKF